MTKFSKYVPLGQGSSIKKRKMKKLSTFKTIIGIILLPFVFVLFFLDRAILVFLPHLDGLSMKKWFNDTKKMMMSVIRVAVVGLIWLIVELIRWKING